MIDAVGEFRTPYDQQATGDSLAKDETRVWDLGVPANHASSLTMLIATAVMTCCKCVFAIPT